MIAAMGKSSTFHVGLIQMRSGRTPQANLDDASKLIGEAKSAGADYVLTPEMTNIMENNRQRLFAAITEEESDPSLAAFRELARTHAIHLHVGSLAIKVSPDKAANRSFLIDPQGEIVAHDKIHMFDVDLGNGESYRESGNFRSGEIAVLVDLPWGRLGLTVCYDLRSLHFIARSPKRAPPSSPYPPPSPSRLARRTGMYSCAPAPLRTAHSSLQPRKAVSTRTAAKLSATRSSPTHGAACWPKAAPNRVSSWRRLIWPKSRPPARVSLRSSMAGASRWQLLSRSPHICA